MARVHPIDVTSKSGIRVGGPKGVPYWPRCPACDSMDVHRKAVLVDEEGTVAIRPQDVALEAEKRQRHLRFQEYTFNSCASCTHTWSSEPTGRWSTRPDRLTSEPDDFRPTLLIDRDTRRPIREALDYVAIRRLREGRVGDVEPATAFRSCPLVVLTGAGASVPFGFPQARDFRLPDWGRRELERLLPSTLLERATSDVEICLDLLLKLQLLAVQDGDDSEFEQSLADLGEICPSWFVFSEELREKSVYPPLTVSAIAPRFAAVLSSSSHYRLVRRLLEWTCTEIVTSCDAPDEASLPGAAQLLKPLIDELRELADGPLPLFTTNYDSVLESIMEHAHERGSVVDGFGEERQQQLSFPYLDLFEMRVPAVRFAPERWNSSRRGDLALFHMHGSPRYLIDLERDGVFRVDCEPEQLRMVHQAAWQSGWLGVLGAIMPATCKDRYIFSEPYCVAYDFFDAALSGARACLIVGQSGRDDTIKKALSRAARENSELQFLVVTLGGLPPHLGDVLPEGRVETYEKGLSEAAADWAVATLRRLL